MLFHGNQLQSYIFNDERPTSQTILSVIQIWCYFHPAPIQGLEEWLLWSFVHGTITVPSWHVQIFVVILIPYYGVTLKPNFHWISIIMKKLLVNWAPVKTKCTISIIHCDLAGLRCLINVLSRSNMLLRLLMVRLTQTNIVSVISSHALCWLYMNINSLYLSNTYNLFIRHN